jgi:hypothetical protein
MAGYWLLPDLAWPAAAVALRQCDWCVTGAVGLALQIDGMHCDRSCCKHYTSATEASRDCQVHAVPAIAVIGCGLFLFIGSSDAVQQVPGGCESILQERGLHRARV